MSYLRKYKFALVGLLLFVVFIFIIKPTTNRLTRTQIEQLQSDSQMQSIGRIVRTYKSEHGGKLPGQFSELIPNDQLYAYLQMFYNPVNSSQSPHDRYTNKMIVDEDGDYVLSEIPGILVYEKPGLWPDGSVAVCYDNLTVKRLTPAEFDALRK